MENKELQLAVLDAMIDELWLEGIISDLEKEKIKDKNREQIYN